jgi:hypothetical protein
MLNVTLMSLPWPEGGFVRHQVEVREEQRVIGDLPRSCEAGRCATPHSIVLPD